WSHLVPARLLEEQIGLAALIWIGFTLLVLAIILGIAYFADVNASVWDPAATQAPRWFALFIGVYLANTILPLHITHGQTRREFSIQATVFIILFAAALATLITIG